MKKILSIAVCGWLLWVSGLGYADPVTVPSENGRIETPKGTVELVPVKINGEYYYRLGSEKQAEDGMKPEDVRKTVARYDKLLPKAFRSDSGIVSKIVTSEDEKRMQEAAEAAQKKKKSRTFEVDLGQKYCCCCGKKRRPPCLPCNCMRSYTPQDEVDKKFKKWKRTHCSPLPNHPSYRSLCEMERLDQNTREGRIKWDLLKSDEYCVTYSTQSIFKKK